MMTKSVEESTPPIGTVKEHTRNAKGSKWKCGLAGSQECVKNDSMNYWSSDIIWKNYDD